MPNYFHIGPLVFDKISKKNPSDGNQNFKWTGCH